jgi:filamentous hemagglutinin family protein
MLCGYILLLDLGLLQAGGAIAQLTPDGSLASESSQVSPNSVTVGGQLSDRVVGGARRGEVLFHSFRDFNVASTQRLYFENPAGVNQIITRVTGNSPSNVLGTLGVLGPANLFLLNPNGILFGANARLDLRGSFTASTASAIQLDNGLWFSASNPQAPPLLTVRVPTGLQWGATAAPIVNQSRATDGTGAIVGLQVDPGQTLSLLGGNLQFAGGTLTAPNGQIELGSVAGGSRVALVPAGGTRVQPQYLPNTVFQDIQLTQQARVDASGAGAGQINMAARHITLNQGSAILADTLGNQAGRGIQINTATLSVSDAAFISTSTFGSGNAGNLSVQASESIRITGQGFAQYQAIFVVGALTGDLQPETRENGIFGKVGRSTGSGGVLSFNTPRLMIQQGGAINGDGFGLGQGASVVVNAKDIELSGGVITVSGIIGSTGNAGTVLINTERLTVQDGAFVVSGTNGSGNANNMVINASDTVLVQNTPDGALFSSSIGTITLAGATGNGGDLEINTGRLIVRGGGAIGTSSGVSSRVAQSVFRGGAAGNFTINARDSVEVSGVSQDGFFRSRLISETYNNSPGGEFKIHTRRLIVRDGGEVSVAAYSSGASGRLEIVATDQVEITGTAADGRKSGLLASSGGPTYLNASGNSGSLQLSTDHLTVRDGATLAVNSVGTGNAGELSITANTIQLDRGGSLIASTASGEGGNIQLSVRDILSLRRNSLISADAGGTGNGGNIAIAARFIAANPLENSDIIANAERGRGGNITLTSQGIFGLAFRPQLTPFSDITASSQFGISGIVQLNTPNIDPSRGTTILPARLVDSSKLIAADCTTRRIQQAQGSLMLSGAGGMPTHPDDFASAPFRLDDPFSRSAGETPTPQPSSSVQPPTATAAPSIESDIVEIDSIYQLPDGTIWLARTCGG